MGNFTKFPACQTRSEALQRSGSPLVVPENVLEAQSGEEVVDRLVLGADL